MIYTAMCNEFGCYWQGSTTDLGEAQRWCSEHCHGRMGTSIIDERPLLSILIPTVGERSDRFQNLVASLSPQVQAEYGDIEVLVYWNNFERPIAEIRQALIEEAHGQYVCFVDDDDGVPSYYCDKIITALQSRPDYVGWRMQLWMDGQKMKPTFHSIKYDHWSDDAEGYYRDISHLNPIKRSIALQVPFTGHDGPEDYSWAQLIAPLVKTEEYIEEPMYFYYYNSRDTIWQGGKVPDQSYTRPELGEHFRYHPECKTEYP